jgi:hypothetical protein
VVTWASTGPRKQFRWMAAGHVGCHCAGFPGPWLFPIRNPCELRGLYCRSYFGPRTCGGGITNVIEVGGALNQGFPFSPLLPYFRGLRDLEGVTSNGSQWRPMMVPRGD